MTETSLCAILTTMKAPTLNLAIQPTTLSDGVTQSELSLLDECALKWNLRYNNRLNRTDSFAWPLFVGSAWHQFQETWRKTKGVCDLTKAMLPIIGKDVLRNADFEEELDYWTAVLPAYQLAYAKLYKEEATYPWLLVEEELTGEHLGFKLRGKIDLACDKPHFIRDFKSTASAWLISPDGWHFKLQFMMYCWLMRANYPKFVGKPFDFQLDIMQKPALKQTKADGTPAGHNRRVYGDVLARPEFYLTRKSYTILPEMIQRFEDNVLTPKLQRLALARDNPDEAGSIITNPNTNACNAFGNRCEFMDNCEKGWDVAKFFFTQRDKKHEEL